MNPNPQIWLKHNLVTMLCVVTQTAGRSASNTDCFFQDASLLIDLPNPICYVRQSEKIQGALSPTICAPQRGHATGFVEKIRVTANG